MFFKRPFLFWDKNNNNMENQNQNNQINIGKFQKLKHLFNDIGKDILLFMAIIFIYEVIFILIAADLKVYNSRFKPIQQFFKMIFTGEILNYPFDFWPLIIFIGFPAVAIKHFLNHFSNKFNFILAPIITVIVSLFILPSFYISVFLTKEQLIYEEQFLNAQIFTSIIFQVFFCFIVAGLVMLKRKKIKLSQKLE